MRKRLLLFLVLLYIAFLFWFVPPSKGQPPPPVSQRVAFVAVDPAGACIDWPSPNASPLEYNYVDNVLWGCNNGTWAVIGQGGGGGGTGTTNILAKFLSSTTIGNSSVSDDGVTTSVTENFNLGTNGLMSAYPNSSSGTVAFTLTKLDNSSNAIQLLTTDTTNAYGVCVIGCAPAATSVTALIAVAGQVQCMFDNQTVVRDFVVASTGVAGDCHDAGSVEPTGVQVVGRVVSLNAGAGSTGIIALFSPDTAQASLPVKTFQLANANPGTVLNEIVALTLSNPVTATTPGTAAIGGMIGVCSGGCGNSGTATIIQAGSAQCVVDGATTAGDYLQASTTNAGQFHDAGATYPVPNQVLGRVASTNGGAGTYSCLIFPPESSNPASATIAAGTINDIVKYTAPSAIGPSGCTIDSSNNEVCPGSMTTGSGGGKTGYALMNGKTSGGQGFSVSDAAGTATLYLLPTAPSNGNFLKDIGSATCPTLPSGAPTACEQLSWSTAGGGTVTTFSAGTLSPLFTTSVATATTTPALTFSLTNAAGGTVFGNNTSSSGAPAYTAAPVLGVDNATAGSLQLANGAANAHNILLAAATTTNTIKFFATAPTTGDVVSCTTASTTCTLTDSGVLAANILLGSAPTNHGVLLGAGTQTVGVTSAGTSGQVLTSNGASSDPTFQAAGGGLTCNKYSITQSPFGTTWTVTGQSGQSVTASTTTQTINIVTLASKTVINALRIKKTTAFTGTSFSAMTMSLGTNASGGSTTSFEPAFDVFSTISDSPFGATPGYLDDGGSFSGADNGETVTATFISTGGNLTATTAGAVDVTLCTTVLP